LHKNLVIKQNHKKILPAAATKPSNRKAPPAPAPTAANINALQAKMHLAPTCIPPTNDQIISFPEPNGQVEKCILNANEERFSSEFDHSIVFKQEGKIKQDPDFDHSLMKPSLSKWHWASKLLILDVITNVIKEHHLLPWDLNKLRLLNKTFSTMIPTELKWVHINIHSL
jgi:hypothetical protein